MSKEHYKSLAKEYYKALRLTNDNLSDVLLLAEKVCNVTTAFIVLGDSSSYSVITSEKGESKFSLNDCVIKTCINNLGNDNVASFKATSTCPNTFYTSVAITNQTGFSIGYLVLINSIEKELNNHEQRCLKLIALQVAQRFEKALELRNSLEAADRSHALLHSVLNTNSDYQILINHKLEVTAYNNCAANFTRHFTGYELEKGGNILTYISNEFAEEFTTLCNKALKGQEVCYEHFVNKKPFENTWFCFTLSPIHSNTAEIIGLIVTGTNINQRKKQEKTIKHQSDSLSVIAQLQSHQVRQPVTSILGLMSLIKEDNYIPQKEYLIGLEKATHQLDEVIQTIVRQSRRV